MHFSIRFDRTLMAWTLYVATLQSGTKLVFWGNWNDAVEVMDGYLFDYEHSVPRFDPGSKGHNIAPGPIEMVKRACRRLRLKA